MKKILTIYLFLVGCVLSLTAQTDVIYESLYDNSSFNRTLNVNLEVGATQGQLNIAPSGAANYTIPITLPPGTHGMVPSLGISYSSQGGNGLLGMGWNLSATSAITRTGKSYAYDGQSTRVKLNYEDYFALDGNKLERTTNDQYLYAQYGSEYATKMESFSKITYIGGSSGFKVVAKNGSISEYGTNESSLLWTNDNAQIIAWYLSKVTDTYGNYIEYVYETINNEKRLKEINYTGNAQTGLLPYNKIQLSYANRTDKTIVYQTGNSTAVNSLLTEILVSTEGGQQTRKYQFSYGKNDLNQSYLNEVKEFGRDNKRCNSTIFQYNNPNLTINDKFSEFTLPANYELVSKGDYNGDGLEDLLCARFTNQTISGTFFREINAITSFLKKKNDIGYTEVFVSTFPVGLYTPNYSSSNLTNTNFPESQDFDGDGKDDILIHFTTDLTAFSSNLVRESYNIYSLGNNTFTRWPDPTIPNNSHTGEVYFSDDNNCYSIVNPNSRFFITGDFDGDGISDIVALLKNCNYPPTGDLAKLFLIRPVKTNRSERVCLIESTFYGNQDNSLLSAANIDGDGKMELVHRLNTGLGYDSKVVSGIIPHEQSTAAVPKFKLDKYDGFAKPFHASFNSVQSADFNGDGISDAVYKNTNQSSVYIEYSNGSTYLPATTLTISNDKFDIGDFNGDGYADIVTLAGSCTQVWIPQCNCYISQCTRTFDIYFSTGTNFVKKTYTFTTNMGAGNSFINTKMFIGDFNADGKSDVYNDSYVYSFNPNEKNGLLAKIQDGHNRINTIDYKFLTETTAPYINNEASTYPLNTFNTPLKVVSSISEPNGIGGTSVTSYKYENGKLHRAGFGFLGFKKFTVTNTVLQTEATSEMEILSVNNTTRPIISAAIKRQTSRHYGQNKDLTESVSTNKIEVANGRYWLKTEKVQEWNKLSGGFVTKEFTYDGNGNIDYEKTITNDEEFTTISRGGFVSIGNSSVPALPTWQIATNSRYENGTFYDASKETQYVYYPHGAVKQEKAHNFKKTGFTQTDYEYNAYGNLTKTTLTSPNLPAKTSISAYDAKERYEESMKNNKGQETMKTHYPETGAVKTATGIDGLMIQYEYDGFGRMTKVTDPFGNTETNIYKLSGGGTTTITNEKTNAPRVQRNLDFLGREYSVFTRITSLDPAYRIAQFTDYDVKGLVYKKSIPKKMIDGFEPPISVYSYTTYDYLNRPFEVTTDGIEGKTSYAYTFSQGKTTVEVTNNAGQKSSKTTDASGKVISTTDHGGTLTFNYDGRGNQTEVKLSGQVITTMEYDDWGRQKALVDANAGRTEYVYNAYGELVSQKDAKNNQYTMQYDELGRMWKRTGAEGVTTTLFNNTAGVAVNTIQSVTLLRPDGTSISESYEYNDPRGRVTKATETIDNVEYSKTFTYNTFNQVLTTTYPSDLVVTNTYNTEGMLTKVMSGAQLLFDATSGKRDAFGHWTEYTRGDNKLNKSEYNAYGTPTRFNTAGVQDLNMVWDLKTGNLLSRQDARGSLKEIFTYDELNRLRTAKVDGLQVYDFVFEDNGNIKSKTDAGSDYFYDAAKFNAVKYVKRSTQTAIPSMQQDIMYTAFLRPSTISEGANKLEYTYASDYERRKGVYTINNIVENTRLYLGDYEINTDKNGLKTFVHYLSAAEAIVVKSGNNAFEYYFPYTDHLGSIVAVTTKYANGNTVIVAEQNFDAWGRKRNVNTWAYDNIQAVPTWLYRGYTGHEHLDAFGLINMNARLYDPILGRMLSPDNYAHEGSQGLNRYSYAHNNPLSYTDPSGNEPITLAALLVSGLVSAAFDVGFQLIGNGGNLSKVNWGSAGVSFVAGATGAWAGSLIGKIPAVAGAISKIASPFWRGAASGAISGAVGGAVGGLAGGIMRGQKSWDLVKATGFGFIVGGVAGGLFGGIKAHRAAKRANIVPDTPEPNSNYDPNSKAPNAHVEVGEGSGNFEASDLLPEHPATPLKPTQYALPGTTEWNQHHILPKAFTPFFSRFNIDVNKYTVWIPSTMNGNKFPGQLHYATKGTPFAGRGGMWNKAWSEFINTNPQSASEIFKFAEDLMLQKNITGPYTTYGSPR
jgi:RHS repeat-associated protein